MAVYASEDRANDAEPSASLMSTVGHIQTIVRKEQQLAAAKAEAFAQLCEAVGREHENWSGDICLEMWETARAMDLHWASQRMAEAMDLSVTVLAQWKRELPPGQRPGRNAKVWKGTFPLGNQITPIKGRPCVYMLLNFPLDVVYVGASCSVRARLKQHWANPDKRGQLDQWEIIRCRDEREMLAVEGDRIYQHQPILNKADRRRRRFSP